MKHAVLIIAVFAALFAKAEGEAQFETCEGQKEVDFENPSLWGVHEYADGTWETENENNEKTVGRSRSLPLLF